MVAKDSRRQAAAAHAQDEERTPSGRGGWRPNAGRPRGRTTIAHGRRLRFPARFPQHVILRVRKDVAPIRTRHLVRVVRGAIRDGHKPFFRIVEFNVLADHVHLIVEAHDAIALARGMQGLEVRLARRLNRAIGRRGTFFKERYHARALRTPAQVRHALAYVLRNHPHHLAQRGLDVSWRWIDPCSSGPWFRGWMRSERARDRRLRALRRQAPPTAPPTTWLLARGWRREGLL